jgi:hypothetical protein
MERLQKIAVLENEVQAGLLAVVLEDRGIPHLIQSYRSAAYDGLFQLSSGWGHVEAPASQRGEVLAAIQDIREVPPLPEDQEGPPEEA